jgi:hypothetical protein
MYLEYLVGVEGAEGRSRAGRVFFTGVFNLFYARLEQL